MRGMGRDGRLNTKRAGWVTEEGSGEETSLRPRGTET